MGALLCSTSKRVCDSIGSWVTALPSTILLTCQSQTQEGTPALTQALGEEERCEGPSQI